MKVVRLAICAALAAGTLVLSAPGAAGQACTEKGGSDRPYKGQGTVVQVLDWDWHAQADPDNGVAGVYWTDGYLFADATPDRVIVRSHYQFGQGWVNAQITVYTDGSEPEVCEDVREP